MTKNVDKTKVSGKIKRAKALPSERVKNRVPAMAQIILEHVWWLGEALKTDDEDLLARETAELYRYAKSYHAFSSSPAKKPIKYMNPEEYPPPPKGRKSMYNDVPDNDEDE